MYNNPMIPIDIHKIAASQWLDQMCFLQVQIPDLQTKMANFASPFWRKLQAARQDCLTLREQRCRHNIEITSIAAYAPGDQRCFCRSY